MVIRGQLNRWIFSLVACFVFQGAPVRAGGDESTQGQSLISHALDAEDLRGSRPMPIVLRAKIEVDEWKRGPARGDYAFTSGSQSQWREEINFGNYRRLRIGDGEGYWQVREINYEPEIIFQLDRLLHLKEALTIGPKETLGKISNRRKGDMKLKCIVVVGLFGADRTLCFDEATSALVSIEYATRGSDPPDITRIVYDNFKKENGILLPYEIRAEHERKPVITVKIEEFATTTLSAPLFNPPSGAERWPQCDDMVRAELLDKVSAIYPPESRANRESGRIAIYGVVETDGSISHMTIVKQGPKSLERAAVEAVRQWRYKPAMCGSTPIRSETNVEVSFSLRY
jgi:TonB family protein